MLPRVFVLRVLALVVTLTLASGLATAGAHTPADRKSSDPRRTRGLFVDKLMPAANQEAVYRKRIGSKSQAFWVIPEAYPTSQVRTRVRAYTRRALAARKTPVLVVYGIPGRDCNQYSSGGLTTPAAYRAWVNKIALGLRRQHALVVLEPDVIGFATQPQCRAEQLHWFSLLRYASKKLSRTGAWVYLDAAHSGWTPYTTRPRLLKRAGVAYARGISTNVSNFRTTAAEKRYAARLLSGLRKLGVRGKRYVIDTSRNGNPHPVDGDVINPTWARVGKAPRLALRGTFDGTLWVKHPGESDGTVNGGPPSGQWCDLLADRLLGRSGTGNC